jgi:TolB-like protein
MRSTYSRRLIGTMAFVVILAFFLPTCHTPPDQKYVKDDKPYGVVKGLFRERWWNFYERGASFSAGEFWQEAAKDFQEAIRQRDKDQRRARTYGMHFTDYFPHRDLGVAYYHLGDDENALKELGYSLSTVESSKTKFYLNKVRQSLLEKSTVDLQPPVITIAEPETGKVTNSYVVTVKGQVDDDAYAASVSINGTPLFLELAAKQLPFAKDIELKSGVNDITIVAKDLTGKESMKQVKVTADFVGPSINITNYVSGQEIPSSSVVLQGALFDDTGIASLSIDGKALPCERQKELPFALALALKEGENKISLLATDLAGNETEGEFTLSSVPGKAGAHQDQGTPSSQSIRLVALDLGVLDTGGNPLLAKAPASEQPATAPAITMKDLTEAQTVFYETIFIDGSAASANDIVRIEVNGEPLAIRPGKNIFFSTLVKLKEGENTFAFKAVDTTGEESAKTVIITREIPQVMDVGSRMALTILPFEQKGEASPAGTMVNDGLLDSFAGLNRFNLVARGADLEAILKELKLSQTDLVDKTKALQVGKLAAAEAVLSGSVVETTKDIEIMARLINTETSTVLATEDVYGQDKSLSNLQFLLEGLALKFEHDFPLVSGLVVKVSGADVFTDLGTNKNLQKEMKVIIYREGEKICHPVTGKILGCDTTVLAEVTLVQVFEDLSKGKLVLADKAQKIQEKDKVITK